MDRVLARGLADSAFPGAIAIIGDKAGDLVEAAVGHLDWAPSPVPDGHTMWDMASLTKVIGPTTAIMQLSDEGKIDIDAPVQRYLPTWIGPGKDRVTVRHLLTHTAGLPAFKAYDLITTDPDSMAVLMFGTPLDTLPGVRMVYSDIGGYLLGRLVQAISGETLDHYTVAHIFLPLRMYDTMFRPPDSLIARIAPTEFDPKRGGLVRGKVHDERAYYLGGVSGHAGLFSSADDLSRFARMLMNGGTLDGTRIVRAATIARFTAFADSTFSNRALGWQKPVIRGMRFSTSAPWAGTTMSTASYGHTGFTGTSIGIDPVHNVYVILLTNRVDPTRTNNRVGAVRVALTNAVLSVLSPRPLGPSRPSHPPPP